MPEASIPQMDGADDSDSNGGSDEDEDAGQDDSAGRQREPRTSEGSNYGEEKRTSMRATAVAIKVEDWFVEVDESLRGFEEGIMKAEGYVGLTSGAVVWVLGNSAWYRLKQPHAAYESTLQAFVDKVTMGDNVCELVRRSPYSSIHKMMDQLVEATMEQQRFQETQDGALGNAVQDASRKRAAISKKAAATVAVPLIHDRAEYLSMCIERAARINTRIEKSRLVTGLLQEATDARARRLLQRQCPELSALALEKARRKGSSKAALGGVWQRYDQEEASEDDFGDTQMQDSDRRAEESETADLLEIAKVLCGLVSRVELDVMRARPTGNTRRMLAPVKSAKAPSRAQKSERAGGAAVSKAATTKAARSGNISALFDDLEQSNTYASLSLEAGISAADVGAAQGVQWSKNKKSKGSKIKEEESEDLVKDGRGKTWHDHLVTLVSRQVLQEVVMQVDKINSCPRGVSATNPSVAAPPLVSGGQRLAATYLQLTRCVYILVAVLSFLWCCPICLLHSALSDCRVSGGKVLNESECCVAANHRVVWETQRRARHTPQV